MVKRADKWIRETACKAKRQETRLLNQVQPLVGGIKALAAIVLEYVQSKFYVWDEEFMLHYHHLNPSPLPHIKLWAKQDRFVKALANHPETEPWRQALLRLESSRVFPSEDIDTVLYNYAPIIDQCNRSMCYYNSCQFGAHVRSCICSDPLTLPVLRIRQKQRESARRTRRKRLL